MTRPAGVTATAALFFAAAAYLILLGAVMLVRPGTVSMMAGSPLLNGLELAGPYMFLLTGSVAALVGWGLLRLFNWARRLAIVIGFAGLVMLVPTVSSAVVDIRLRGLISGGLGIIVRVIVIWYLWQTPVRDVFASKIADLHGSTLI